jgi:serine/threonine protein kinase/WD40 repeat protein
MSREPIDEKEVFNTARRLTVLEERVAYLQHVCGHEPKTLHRIVELLNVYFQQSSFLESPAVVPGATLDEPIREGPGTIIGPYKLMEQIGEGGMGLVFVAEQQQPIRRKVALKVIKPGMDTRQVVARFEAERQALALMDHANIAKVLDGGQTACGQPYFVMELVKGKPITEFCDQNQVAIRQRLELLVSVCQAVQHAHQKGIIHRDLKPSNVLVMSHDGTPVVKVIDFGVAKAIGQQLTDKTIYTQSAQMVGTPLYMSPEQAGQSGLDVDTRSDIYSLGVLLYELLTGTTPFDRNRLHEVGYEEMQRIIREEEPPRPSTRIRTLGQVATTVSMQRRSDPRQLSRLFRGELDWIVMKALEKDRNRRYETANGFATDVQRYLQDEPVRACPPSVVYRLRKFIRRNKAAFLTTLAVAASLVLAVVVLAISTVRINTALRKSRLREAEALVGQAHGTRLSRRPGQRFEALDALSKAAAIGRELGQSPEWFDRLRNEAIAALALPDVHITQEFGSFSPGSVWVELNEDFTLYVRTTDKGDCAVRRVDDDAEVAHLSDLDEPTWAGFGTGRILAVLGKSSHRFQLWDLNGVEPALRFKEHGVFSWGFRADGRLLALSHEDDSLSVYETASGKRVYRVTSHSSGSALAPALHPTEPFVACYTYFHPGVPVYDLRTGKVVPGMATPWPGGSSACWSPDGRSLFVGDSNGGIIQEYAFDAAAPALRLLRPIQGPNMGGAEITFNPAGDRFVRRGWGGVVVLFDAVSGQELFRTHSLPPASVSYRLCFDRTGQRLAGALVGDRRQRIGLWSVADGRKYRSLVHPGSAEGVNEMSRPAIHPGGRLAALALVDGVALFDLESGRELAHLQISTGRCFVSFDGAGSLLTNGFEGFYRWPVRADSANPGRLLVGPPELLPFHPGNHAIAASHDGRIIGQCMWAGYGEAAFAGGWILHPNSPTPRRVDAGTSMGHCSVSPDGRWVAFDGPNDTAGHPIIHVYDAATAECIWQSPVQQGGTCCFSPDGRWLVTGTDGGRLYAVGNWEPGPQLGPGRPWDVTSELAIVGQTDGIYRLVELATGRELARLEDPEQNSGAAAFTPDGTKLVVVAKNGLRVWDLHRVRAELANLGLDWDAPSFPAAASTGAPLSIHVALGDTLQRAQAHSLVEQAERHIGAKEHAKALAALRQAVKIAPKYAEAHNELAWLLLTGPKELRDPAQALRLARSAVELELTRALHLNTWGVALYYTGRYAEAIPILERSLLEREGQTDAFDHFFLAMCHHRLGDAAKAKEWFERGKQWFQAHKGRLSAIWAGELTTFQAEAEGVLAQPPSHEKK